MTNGMIGHAVLEGADMDDGPDKNGGLLPYLNPIGVAERGEGKIPAGSTLYEGYETRGWGETLRFVPGPIRNQGIPWSSNHGSMTNRSAVRVMKDAAKQLQRERMNVFHVPYRGSVNIDIVEAIVKHGCARGIRVFSFSMSLDGLPRDGFDLYKRILPTLQEYNACFISFVKQPRVGEWEPFDVGGAHILNVARVNDTLNQPRDYGGQEFVDDYSTRSRMWADLGGLMAVVISLLPDWPMKDVVELVGSTASREQHDENVIYGELDFPTVVETVYEASLEDRPKPLTLEQRVQQNTNRISNLEARLA